jgi:hypothetical protein
LPCAGNIAALAFHHFTFHITRHILHMWAVGNERVWCTAVSDFTCGIDGLCLEAMIKQWKISIFKNPVVLDQTELGCCLSFLRRDVSKYFRKTVQNMTLVKSCLFSHESGVALP